MKNWSGKIAGWLGLLLLISLNTEAAVYYVNVSNTGPVPPFTSWATAATNIQDAIDVAGAGDTVLVTNGVYASGGSVVAGGLTNRIALTQAMTVQSVNGPWATTILGAGATNGPTAVRCAWLTNGAALVGFTLTGGATYTSGSDFYVTQAGGGVWCASTNAVIANCVIVSNTASYAACGVYQGTISSSLIWSNSVTVLSGGAVCKSILNSCTVVSNATYGVASPIAMTNTIIYYNSKSGNVVGTGSGNFSHCCTIPALPGLGNLTNAPQLFADNVHFINGSPCIGAGIDIGATSDIFGRPWANPPSIGCAEVDPAPFATAPQMNLSSIPLGFSVGGATIAGSPPYNFAWLKDGVMLSDDGHFNFTQSSNLLARGVQVNDAGKYQLVIRNAFGVTTSGVAQVVIHKVSPAALISAPPYTSWNTAARNIQDAIDAAATNEIVLVTNGTYATGGKSMDGVITNRISVDKLILVASVNGPGATIIQGAWDPVTTNGPGAVRCAWLTNNAILGGFTLQGGATRGRTAAVSATSGGGVWGAVLSQNQGQYRSWGIIVNSVITKNAAASSGGGAYGVEIDHCTIATNLAVASSGFSASGGGAEQSSLTNCYILGNQASQNGGGADSCILKNCALTGNSAFYNGGAANGSVLVNCTITANTASGYSSGYGAAVYGATLTNCIVTGNFSRTSYPNTNYASCTLAYCCADPLSTGPGNIDVNPLVLADNIHLAAASPCIAAGISNAVVGTDIDGQSWNTPPAIGCDEWQPAPVMAGAPGFQIEASHLVFNLAVAGQPPFAYFWSKDGLPLQDDGHYSNSGTASLTANQFGPADAGVYAVSVTNSSGSVTSTIVQITIHAVSAGGSNPVPPYASWDTAATNIQDAINFSGTGDIVLVTNGIYATGGMAVDGTLTNRVVINRPVQVVSVNGYQATIIQGARDPVAVNGPGAIRCAYLADGATLSGFTLRNGATLATGDFVGGPLESGGGVYCGSTLGVVANCLFTNNSALYGGAIFSGTLENSLLIGNAATRGGGAYFSTLNNCTVENNMALTSSQGSGGGTYGGLTRNSIVVNNRDLSPFSDNFSTSTQPSQYSYSCTAPGIAGTGNISASPQFVDEFNLSSASPCYGTGNPAYANGVDLNGLPWNNPPSMGCAEVVATNLAGPILLTISPRYLILPVNHLDALLGFITGHVSSAEWSFGDGITLTNIGLGSAHSWTNAGNYTVTFTAFNNDYPGGVSTSVDINVQPLLSAQLQAPTLTTNGVQFQFLAQTNANYTIQYTTNLVAPVWQQVQYILFSPGGPTFVSDPANPDAARFYRVLAN